jgi:hypothetical protein
LNVGKSEEKPGDAKAETGKAKGVIPEMAERLVSLEARVKVLEAKTERPH